jgi:UDP-3-O-[3-hydroxymyristoyl] glucosamine N-acyltransferase
MVTLSSLLESIHYLHFNGDKDVLVSSMLPLPDSVDECISDGLYWLSEKKLDLFKRVTQGTFICSNNWLEYTPSNHELNSQKTNFIFVDNPRRTFQEIVRLFFTENEKPFIAPTAVVHESAILGKNISLGHYCVIEENCSIDDDAIIGPNTVIHKGSVIGKSVKIGANCTIGGVGFGYEKNEEGTFEVIPHIGNVIIKDFVEIGNNTCIDRAALGSTVLHEHVKVDNLVHIAHGVVIGRNSLIIANSMIAGSTRIGENVWVAPSASLMNGIEVKENAIIGMGCVVLKSVAQKDTVVGNPGKSINKSEL